MEQNDDWVIPEECEEPQPDIDAKVDVDALPEPVTPLASPSSAGRWGNPGGTNTWWEHDLVEGVSRRRAQDSQTNFDMDVALLQSTIDALPKYDERTIRHHIQDMDFSVPKGQLTVGAFTEAYDRISTHRQNLAHYRDVVGQHLQVYEKYHRALTDTAAALFKSGTVPERAANANNLTMEVFHGIRQPKALLSYIEDYVKLASDASFQVNALIKLVEAEMRLPSRALLGESPDTEQTSMTGSPSTYGAAGSWGGHR